MTQAICLGNIVVDVVVRVVRSLPPRGKIKLVEKIQASLGGGAVNTGVSLAKLGVKTAIIGKIGNDEFGTLVLRKLEESGVDLRGIIKSSEIPTSATVSLVYEDGERGFFHFLGGNASLEESEVNLELYPEAKWLHISSFFLIPKLDGEPAANILKKGKQMKLFTSLDTTWDTKGRWISVLTPCLKFLDVLFLNFIEGKMLTGKDKTEEIADYFLSKGVGMVAIKMDKNGCFIKSREDNKGLKLPAYSVKVKDSTGAGDAFCAGFLIGILKGWDIERTGRFANAAGASCITEIGGTDGVSIERIKAIINGAFPKI